MAIAVWCQECFHEFAVSERLVGKRVKCPECGKPVAVTDDVAEALLAPPSRSPKKKTSGRSKKFASAKSSGISPTTIKIALGVLGVLVLIGGVVALVSTVDFKKVATARKTPRRKIDRTELKFKAEMGEAKTTSEWFEKLREMHTSQKKPRSERKDREIILEIKLKNPEQFIGPDPAVLPIVLEALTDRKMQPISEAILKKFEQSEKPPYFVDVLAGLKHENPLVNRHSAPLLSLVRVDDDQTVPEMTKLLNGPDATVAGFATLGLGKMEAEGFPPLHERLRNAGNAPPKELLLALRSQGANSVAALPELTSLLGGQPAGQDGNPSVRTGVLSVLTALGPAAAPALPQLERMLIDEPNGTWSDALTTTFAAIGPAALETLIKGLAAEKPNSHGVALAAVDRLGNAGTPAATHVVPLLSSSHSALALRILERLLPTAQLPADQLWVIFEQRDNPIRVLEGDQLSPSEHEGLAGKIPLRLLALDQLAADPKVIAAALPRVRAVREATAANRERLAAEVARLQSYKDAVIEVYVGGRLDALASKKKKEKYDDAHGKASSAAGELDRFLKQIDRVLQTPPAS